MKYSELKLCPLKISAASIDRNLLQEESCQILLIFKSQIMQLVLQAKRNTVDMLSRLLIQFQHKRRLFLQYLHFLRYLQHHYLVALLSPGSS